MRKTKEQKAITLIALIITIVVLLILAAVAINAITQYNIIENANSAAQKYGNQVQKEDETLGSYSSEIDEYMGGATGGNGSGEGEDDESTEEISLSDSLIGCYADVDGNGTVDGIIFADLAFSKSGQWAGINSGIYSYDAKPTLNNYTVRDATTEEQGLFKGAISKVISPVDKVEANDRFYIMALEDIEPGTKYCCWWANAKFKMSDYGKSTSGEFGTGKSNTVTMIGKWNAKVYGEQNTGLGVDMWGVIQEEVLNGWFVPSRAEWAAFSDAFSITMENYTEYGLSKSGYWSSSQGGDSYSACVLINCWMAYMDVDKGSQVRLSTTF